MARLATTTDVFNAIAEPQRRAILDLLVHGERSVNDVAELLDIRQPQASKHLRVLREVGLVSVREVGQQHFYALNAQGLQPIHTWVKQYEQYWMEQFERLDAYLETLQKKEQSDESGTS